MRNRKEQRKLAKEQKQMDRKNAFNKLDLTPYNAIRVMKGKSIVLR